MPTAIVTPINDGPYRIQGEFRITTQGGKPIAVSKDEVWLCRCGHSNNKPFCDGSHKKAGFASNLDEKPQEGWPAGSRRSRTVLRDAGSMRKGYRYGSISGKSTRRFSISTVSISSPRPSALITLIGRPVITSSHS